MGSIRKTNQIFNRRDFLKLLPIVPLVSRGLHKWSNVIAVDGSGQLLDEPKKNIILILFDALSANHLSLYGYPRHTTPNIDRLARNAIVYHNHYSGGNFTTPGTASILTGTYPFTHRALHHFGTTTNRISKKHLFHELSDNFHTVAFTRNVFASLILHQFSEYINELYKFSKFSDYSFGGVPTSQSFFSNDYITAFQSEIQLRGFLGNINKSLSIALVDDLLQNNFNDRLNKSYRNQFPRGIPTNGFGHNFIFQQSVEFVKSQILSYPQPFFAYYHFWPPHDLYSAHVNFVNKFDDNWFPISKPFHLFSEGKSREETLIEQRYYDEYLAYVDYEFADLIKFLESSGLLDNSVLIITSDHGEMFERGILKHTTRTLYEPIIKVPLIIKIPGSQKRVDVYEKTSCVDILPTLVHMSKGSIPNWCEGKVLPGIGESDNYHDRSIYALEAKENPKIGFLTTGTVAIIKGQYKLIHYFGYQGFKNNYELYNLEIDPDELNDLYDKETKVAACMREELKSKLDEKNELY